MPSKRDKKDDAESLHYQTAPLTPLPPTVSKNTTIKDFLENQEFKFRLYRFCWHSTKLVYGVKVDPDDLFQQVNLNLYRMNSPPLCEDVRDALRYAMPCVRHESFRLARMSGERVMSDLEPEAQIDEMFAEIERVDADTMIDLHQAIKSLPIKHQKVVAKFCQGSNSRDGSHDLGTSQSAYLRTLSEALLKLRAKIG